MQPPTYGVAILNALRNGYRVDARRGIIYGLKGKPLSIKLHGTQRYPTVPLVVKNMARRYYAVPAHKVVAASVYGREAFEKHVRHGKGGVLDIRIKNLKLGTPSENEMDKPAYVRSRSAKLARAAQPRRPANSILTISQIRWMLKRRVYGPTGRIRRGIVSAWAAKYGVTKTCISGALKTYGRKN